MSNRSRCVSFVNAKPKSGPSWWRSTGPWTPTCVPPRGDVFTARLNRVRGEKPVLPNQDAVDTVLGALQGAQYTIGAVERKEVRRRPYPPFITSSLQQEASRKLRFNPRKTMVLAQQLYEGITLGAEGSVGLITYMRTDSTRIAGEALAEVRAFIGEKFRPEMLPEKPNFYKGKKDAQDAHEAIRPSSVYRTPDLMKPYLDNDQYELYTLIWKRFVACQMEPAVLDQMTVDVAAGDYEFRASGSVVKFAGFTELYIETVEDSGNGNGNGNGGQNGDAPQQALPEVREGEAVTAEALKPEQHFTKPPARYSEASLIRALEENGIGRPSTYAPTIGTIQERGYVLRDKGRLAPTELGEQVNKLLLENFPDILDLSFTARMEDDLDHVEEGKREWHDLLRSFYDVFSKDLVDAQKRMLGAVGDAATTCPNCGSPMELRESWFGVFVACSRYPECKTTVRPEKAAPEPTNEICEKCGAPMVIRTGRFGRFMACSTYPTCKNAHNVDKQGNKIARPEKAEPKRTDQKCPTCGKTLLIRTSRTGEEFYGCEGYPKCKFTKPMELGLKCLRPGCQGNLVSKLAKRRRFIGCDTYPACGFTVFGQLERNTPCAKCGNPWTTVVKSKSKPTVRRCPAPHCEFEEEIEQSEE